MSFAIRSVSRRISRLHILAQINPRVSFLRAPNAQSSRTLSFRRRSVWESCSRLAFSTHHRLQNRASRSVNEIVEELEELYATARDEFEIATEETEDNTIYAADDRIAAREHLEKLQETYDGIVDHLNYTAEAREEVKRRAGQRIRELVKAMEALEEKAHSQE